MSNWCLCSSPSHRASLNLTLLQNHYGRTSCSLLRVNSGGYSRSSAAAAATAPPGAGPTATPAGAQPEFYKRCRFPCLQGGGAGEPESRPAEPPQGLGFCLGADDLAAVAQMLMEFCGGTLLPRLEERVTRLNVTIAATRKGLKNRLTRLWKGAAGDAPTQQVRQGKRKNQTDWGNAKDGSHSPGSEQRFGRAYCRCFCIFSP